MKKRIIFFVFFIGIYTIGYGQEGQANIDQVFHVNKTPIWSYAFLRNTTKEFLETAKGLEQNLIGAEERWKNNQEKELVLRQSIEMAEWTKSIADLGVNYAQQSKLIAEKNADVAKVREQNKAAQIREGEGTLSFIKKKNEEIVKRNFWANLGPAIFQAATAAVAAFIPGGQAIAASTALSFASGGAGSGAFVGQSNQKDQNAMQERQIQDQINQMKREQVELEKVSIVSAEQIRQEENAIGIAHANVGKADTEVRHARERLNDFLNNNTRPESEIIAAIQSLRKTYIQYAIVLAKLTEKAYQAEEVVTTKIIQDNYTSGNTGEWLAADRILLDLNTIEFNRITQKKQKPNFSTLTISLNNKDAWQLDLLRQRGVMSFEITQFEVDLGFPGTYAQTIKDIDVTVIALADPSGVKGQLTKEGLSWKKVPAAIVENNPYSIDDWFKYVPSGYRAMIFDDENETLILPKLRGVSQEPGLKGIFEGKPICGTYTLELPKYANSFDYGTIVDVVVTINFSSYYDETLKAMVETEICEMDRAEDFVNKRVMPVSMVISQPDEWYQFMNPDEKDTLAHKRRYLPFYLRRNYFPTNQLNPKLNELSVTFVKDGRYIDVKFAVTAATMNPGKKLLNNKREFDPIKLDTMQVDWFNNFAPLTHRTQTNTGDFYNDTVFVHVADSLLLSAKKTNMPSTAQEEYELWILKIEANSIPELCIEDKPGVFDEEKLAGLNDIAMHFGYQFSNDFCITSGRVYAYMDVTDDTTKIRAIDATMQKVPFLYVREAGAYKKRTQDRLAWYQWGSVSSGLSENFNVQRIIHKEEYADLVPFYSFLKAKTPIEEIEVKFDIGGRDKEMILYCSPSWIQMRVKKIGNDSLELRFEVDLNQRDRFRQDSIWVLAPQRVKIQTDAPKPIAAGNTNINVLEYPNAGQRIPGGIISAGNTIPSGSINSTGAAFRSDGQLLVSSSLGTIMPGSSQYTIQPIATIPPIRVNVYSTPKYTFSNKYPVHLIFRYLNLPDNSGRATVDISIIEYDREGNTFYSKLFNKSPVFYRWRNDYETNFALRMHRDDNPQPGFILRDIKFSDFARF